MTLVKSLHSDDPDVIRNMQNLQGVIQATSHPPCKCYSAYILVQLMYVHVTTCTEGSHVTGFYVAVPNTINELSGWLFSRVLASYTGDPAGFESWPGHVSRGTSRMEMTLVSLSIVPIFESPLPSCSRISLGSQSEQHTVLVLISSGCMHGWTQGGHVSGFFYLRVIRKWP